MRTASKQQSVSTPIRGRPREFDLDDALEKAIRVFAEKGYHATSISDLAQVMELTSGSIYKAFADKRAVFLAAMDRYLTVRGERLRQALATKQSGRDRIRAALNFYVDSSYGLVGRGGCMVVGSAAELASFDPEVAQRVSAAFDRLEAMMGRLIAEGQADKSIRADLPVAAILRCILCVVQGMRVVGKTGRTRAEMAAIVDIIMKTLD
jgi:AcrR family transcriptional regulator